jgi:hypothetical protein
MVKFDAIAWKSQSPGNLLRHSYLRGELIEIFFNDREIGMFVELKTFPV